MSSLPNEDDTSPGPLDEVFAGAVQAAALSLAFRFDLLRHVRFDGYSVSAMLALAPELSSPGLRSILTALEAARIVKLHGDLVLPGPHFAEACVKAPYFFWFFSGHGRLLANPTVSHGRDGLAITRAGAAYGRRQVDPFLVRFLQSLQFSSLADLGCGAGDRLFELHRMFALRKTVGVDRDADVIRRALEVCQAAAIGGLAFVREDLEQLSRQPPIGDIDVLLCVFLGHDLWPRERCLMTLDQLSVTFPDAEHFLLCDTFRVDRHPDEASPVFVPGFHLTHGLMNKYVPSEAEWRDLFAISQWELVDRTAVGVPDSAIFHLVRRSLRGTRRRYWPALPKFLSRHFQKHARFLLPPEEEKTLSADEGKLFHLSVVPSELWTTAPWLGCSAATSGRRPAKVVTAICLPELRDSDTWERWGRSGPTLEYVTAIVGAQRVASILGASAAVIVADDELRRDLLVHGCSEEVRFRFDRMIAALSTWMAGRFPSIELLLSSDPRIRAPTSSMRNSAHFFPQGVARPWGRPRDFWTQLDFLSNIELFSYFPASGIDTLLMVDHDQVRTALAASRSYPDHLQTIFYWPFPSASWDGWPDGLEDFSHGDHLHRQMRTRHLLGHPAGEGVRNPRRMHRGESARWLYLDSSEDDFLGVADITLREMAQYLDPTSVVSGRVAADGALAEVLRRLRHLDSSL